MTSTHPTQTTPVSASANLVVLRRFVDEILNQGRFEVMAELVHPDYRYYGPDGGQISGREGLQDLIAGFRDGFSDLHAQITSEIEDSEHVVMTMILTGTHDGYFAEMPPGGKRFELPIAVVTRFVDGQIIEDREYFDTATMMTQLVGEAR